MKQKNIYLALIPLMLSFFVMAFVDLVGIATNYVKADFALSDGKFIPLDGLLLVSDLICTHRHDDESNRKAKDGSDQSCGNSPSFTPAFCQLFLPIDACYLFSTRDW